MLRTNNTAWKNSQCIFISMIIFFVKATSQVTLGTVHYLSEGEMAEKMGGLKILASVTIGVSQYLLRYGGP